MSLQRKNEQRAAFLLLLLLVLGTHLGGSIRTPPASGLPPCREKIYVQVAGEVNRPGVYAFCSRPSLGELVEAAGGWSAGVYRRGGAPDPSFTGGDRVSVHTQGGRYDLTRGEMPGFYKMTLGIPLSLNRETAAGLNALPGIGPGLAALIVEERSRRGGFRSLEELSTVRGIGRHLFERVKPYLVL
ncbi:MAG: helix-hairpin-helix domain-containing protein [Thermodesulfobacteriota bacterium]